jgi:hypothetical protein
MTTPVLTSKEVVCPTCYLAVNLVLSSDPRMPAPDMLWYCRECHDIAVFDDNLDLRQATDVEKARAAPVQNLPR